MKKRYAPAWLWPALISSTLALVVFFLVMILVPGIADSYLSGSARPVVQTRIGAEPIVTRTQIGMTQTTKESVVAIENGSKTDYIAETTDETRLTMTSRMSGTTKQTDTLVDKATPMGSPATLLIRRAVDRVKPSILTLYVSMPERGEQMGRGSMFSGIVIDADGYFVTPTSNLSFALTYKGKLHEDAVAYAYLDGENTSYTIEMIAHDRNTDLALLRILDAPVLQAVTLAVEPKLELGDLLIVLGGSDVDMRDLSLSVGYLTGIERRSFFESGLEYGMIQTSAFVTPIMSGAALLDPSGQTIGLINSNVSRNYSDLHGYAVPSDVLNDVVTRLREPTSPSLVRRVWLGVRTLAEDEYAEIASERAYPAGLMVAEVLENGPAASSDIRQHDVIISVDDELIESLDHLNRTLEKRFVGERVKITLYRTEIGRYVTTYVYLREPES